jgi:hypothetical protein
MVSTIPGHAIIVQDAKNCWIKIVNQQS